MPTLEGIMHRLIVASLVVSGFGVANSMSGSVVSAPPQSPRPAGDRETPDSAALEADLAPLDAVAIEAWQELSRRRIYFAHQSVGSNILRGMERIEKSRPAVVPNIAGFGNGTPRAQKKGASLSDSGLFHGPAGKNGDPLEKIASFERFLIAEAGRRDGQVGEVAAGFDIALLKLCYADITRSTDVTALFTAYCAAIERIERDCPKLRIIHCTVPLRTAGQGAKAAVKRLIGAGTGEANAARGRFNDLVRARFPASRIFDIARIESRSPDGSQAFDTFGGTRWPALCEAYSRDGGHLNELGQEVLAREMLLVLVRNTSESALSGESRRETR